MEEKTRRQNKVEELLRHIAAAFLSEISDSTSLITVTRVSVSRDLKRATVYITVLPQEKQQQSLEFVQRKASELRERARKQLKTRALPFFEFEIDYGELNRQRLDEISRDLKD